MARSTDFGTKRIPVGNARTKEITYSIDERKVAQRRQWQLHDHRAHNPARLPHSESHQIP